MKRQTPYIFAMCALALAGCQRESLITDDNAIRYKVTVADIATKGTLVNNNDNSDYSDIALATALSPFKAAAYNGTTAVFDTEGLDPAGVETVKYTSGAWKTQNTYYWPQKTMLTFFAYGNLPTSGSSVEITSSGQTLTHAMISAVADQKDILLGYYTGNGSGIGTAEIRFWHPLTAVIFREGDLGGEKVMSITLEGLAVSGSVAMDADGIIGAWDVDDYTATSSQSNSEGLAVNPDTKVIGDPFILIPQNLATKGVHLTVKCKSGLTLATDIGSGEWKSQKTNYYTLSYGASTNWTLAVTPWDDGVNGDISTKDAEYEFEVSKESHTFRNTTAQEIATIGVTSKMLLDDEPIGNPEWTIKSYQIGTSDPVTFGGSKFTAGGLTVETTAEGNLQLTAAARTSVNPGLHDYWTNNGGISGDSDGSGWSPADWTTTTASSPIDLSMFDPYTDTPNAYGMTTANCYVIRHAGTYKLPLVYGNAVQDGNVYADAYAPTMTAGDATKFLSPFQNHLGTGITSAFIENNTNCTASSTAIIWQDEATVIKNVEIVGSGSAPYDASSVRYLQFTVDNSTVCQNNAIIAVKDGSGNIMWSWHIWTTNDPALLSDPIAVTNFTNKEYDFFPIYNLGWTDSEIYPSRSDLKIILQQEMSGNEIEIILHQPSVLKEAGRGCYYQFGRKDPMPSTATDPAGFSVSDGLVSLSTAIQNPGVFYKNDGNWCSSNYYNLWTGMKSESGTFDQVDGIIKTIFDPSPVGYKMPASAAFTVFTTTGENVDSGAPVNCNVAGDFTKGWNFYTKPGKQGGLVFFPATGSRYFTDGSIVDVGNTGNYWTAFPNNENHSCFGGLAGGDIKPKNSGTRACAYSVRPVLELQSSTSASADIQDYNGHSL